MSELSDLQLVLFFTEGVSLKEWDKLGMLEREVGIYKALQPHLRGITFVTYGDKDDLSYNDCIPGIKIICNRYGLSPKLYQFWVSRFAARQWHKPWLAKSNQIHGAEISQETAKRFNQPFLARCGYLPSNISAWFEGETAEQALEMRAMEKRVFQNASACEVTTTSMKEKLVKDYEIPSDKIRIIPNYVDTDIFSPQSGDMVSRQAIYIGRLREEKNVRALIEATHGLEMTLLIVGSGPLREDLEKTVREKELPVRFLGNIPNSEIPALLNQSSIFILPSHIEHHPKSLVEAMSCGRAVIGTNVADIRDIITHGENGYLCEPDPGSIHTALHTLLNDPGYREKLGENARKYVLNNLALTTIKDIELALYEEIIHDHVL